MRCPACLVTDGRCVSAEVSCVLTVADVHWPLQEVSRVLGDRWPMYIGRSFPCVW